ncbi:hypothetical protein [Micromonospora sp. WMMD812]|uniref:hypothetical protein n=1 Tax=Micromonospora sp. WMMD812 TaxID=3015152 RepID=UPI00248B0603|nr:hypothetical protein [Micromonospora sp. WMMD812]WBB67637.1 hypothetical protein O7603_31930 [Micromonospora sp. WMMD812]
MSRRTGKPSYLLDRPGRQQRHRIRLLIGAATAVIMSGVIGGLIGFSAGQPTPVEASVADMRESEAKRDVQQIIELTEAARRTGDQLAPILLAITQESEAGRAPEASRVRDWQQTMSQLTEQYANPPSGMTATNVARGGLRSAVEQAAIAVDSVALAAVSPATSRKDHLALAARQAALATTTWSVAATQLDQINIDAGQGHQHVHLDNGGGPGHMSPDGEAEGAGG